MGKHLTLRQARALRRLTQQQLEAETVRLGFKVDQRNISKIESGGITDPRNSTVSVLERALNLKRGTLVFRIEAERAAS